MPIRKSPFITSCKIDFVTDEYVCVNIPRKLSVKASPNIQQQNL